MVSPHERSVGPHRPVRDGLSALRGHGPPAVAPVTPAPGRTLQPELARARRLPGLRVSPDALALAGLAGVVAALIALTWGTWGDPTREMGYDLLAAAKIANGELPYADFVYYYGPLGASLLGGVFGVLGIGLGSAFAYGLTLSVGIVGATYALARQLVGPASAFLAAALGATAAFTAGNNSFVVPHTYSATTAIVFSLLALLGIAIHARRGGRAWLALAGVASGLVMLTRPEFVAALGVALAFWLVGQAIARRGDRRGLLLDLCALALPLLGVAITVYGALLTQVSLHALIAENLFPTGELEEAGVDQLKFAAPLTAASFAELAGRLVLYAGACVALLGAALVLARRPRLAAVAGAVGVLLFLAVLVANPEALRRGLQAVYGWIPAGAAVIAVAVAWQGLRARNLSPALRAALPLIAFVAVLGAKTYAAFFPHPNAAVPQPAAYAMPFAAVLLAWLHLEVLPRVARKRASAQGSSVVRAFGLAWLALLIAAGSVLAVSDSRDESFTVRGLHGQFTAAPQEGVAYQKALDAISRTTRPGEPILLAPQMTALYVVSGRSEPLPELSLLPGALATPPSEDKAIARMGSVRLVIADRHVYEDYGFSVFGRTYNRRLGEWLRRDFRRVAVLRGAGPRPRVLDHYTRREP